MIKNKMKQDNPFATGVSINQDMVMEEGAAMPSLDLSVPDNLKKYHETGIQMSEDAVGLIGMGETPRIDCVDYDPANPDRYNADLYANHPTLEEDLRKCFTKRGDDRRQLLALGREEE